MKIEQIKQEIDNLPTTSDGKRVFTKELRQEILKARELFQTKYEAADYFGIEKNLISKWSRSINAKYVTHGASSKVPQYCSPNNL